MACNFPLILILIVESANSSSAFHTQSHTFRTDKLGAFIAFPHIQVIENLHLNIVLFFAVPLDINICLVISFLVHFPILLIIFAEVVHQSVAIVA